MTQTYTIASDRLRAVFEPRGARLRSLTLAGGPNLVLFSEDPAFEAAYGGVLIGPVANRVRDGRLSVGGAAYQMPQNEGTTCLHSGPSGAHAQDWTVTQNGPEHLIFELRLEDGACGLPGTRIITATFTALGASLHLSLHAITDAPTPMALAHHPYWALGGTPHLYSPAPEYLPTDTANVPTGEIAAVDGTEFDFRTARPVPPEIDHNLCLARARAPDPVHIATLIGRDAQLRIDSTEPGLQVYSGSGLPSVPGTEIAPFAGCALEPQDWPNAINTDHFPKILITPETPYRQITCYTLATVT